MQNRTWAPPGWPWELELLALIFVITSIAIPVYMGTIEATETSNLSLIARAELEKQQEVGAQWDNEDFLWAVVIVGLYLAFLVMASASHSYISTPFTHLVSPLIFGMLTYYRLFKLTADSDLDTPIVSEEPWMIFLWVLGILVITFMVARIRMARHMLRFRNAKWDLITDTAMDRTYFSIILHLTPLLYTPRNYLISRDGILIQGRLYVMPIPFDAVQSIAPVKTTRYISSGLYLATSGRHLVRIQLTDTPHPVFISPKDRDVFLTYCAGILGPSSNLSTDDEILVSTDEKTKTAADTDNAPRKAQVVRRPTSPGTKRATDSNSE